MCLLLVAHRAHPSFSLVVAANRDEAYDRPSAPAGFWPDAPHVLAGRDLEAGGAWLGVTRGGRFAALTNYREPGGHCSQAPSRGTLVRSFLEGVEPAGAFLESLTASGNLYNGFSMIFGEGGELFHFSNRNRRRGALAPGVYGLSNGSLDEPWPKVVSAKAAFGGLLREPAGGLPDRLFSLLQDRSLPPREALPATGVSLGLERSLGAIFVKTPMHGTRCSTVVLMGSDGQVYFEERPFNRDARPGPSAVHRFALGQR